MTFVIKTSHLFMPLHRELITLLRSLGTDQWHAPTVAGEWRVRDVAAHLLQGDLQRLSHHRDGYAPYSGPGPSSYEDVLALINAANRAAVAAFAKYSPHVITDLLDATGTQVDAFFAALDPFGPAPFAVAWAGEDASLNWLDIGREYTERWHHQMQIRDAVGAPLLLGSEWVEPLFALSVRALPRAYAATHAAPGTRVAIHIENGGDWLLTRGAENWELSAGRTTTPTAEIRVPADTAWRIFYNGMPRAKIIESLAIAGDKTLALPFADARSIMI